MVEASDIAAATGGLAYPHTTHCLADGNLLVSHLGVDGSGDGRGVRYIHASRDSLCVCGDLALRLGIGRAVRLRVFLSVRCCVSLDAAWARWRGGLVAGVLWRGRRQPARVAPGRGRQRRRPRDEGHVCCALARARARVCMGRLCVRAGYVPASRSHSPLAPPTCKQTTYNPCSKPPDPPTPSPPPPPPQNFVLIDGETFKVTGTWTDTDTPFGYGARVRWFACVLVYAGCACVHVCVCTCACACVSGARGGGGRWVGR